MSCNQPLYEEEEQACRDTFLKDAEGEGIPYYFYKSVNSQHPTPEIDEETHTIYLDTPDGLSGTGRKTVAALESVLGFDFDYLIKTNVSTYLNIKNIVKGMNKWDGKDDMNIYGARYLINPSSKNIPFPRGFFTVLSKTLSQGVIEIAQTLANNPTMPRTDDTVISLALLYYLQKRLDEKYLDKIKVVPSVTEWTDYIIEDPAFDRAFAIRCKDEKIKENTPENIIRVHEMVKTKAYPAMNYRPATTFETSIGMMSYNNYLLFDKMMEKIKTLIPEKPNGE